MPLKISTAVDTLQAALSRYESIVPAKLHDLDKLRFDTIPTAVASRVPPYLEKKELVQLVEWKLKHGKFRPNLLKFAESNPADLVKETTQDAFACLKETSGTKPGTQVEWTKVDAALKKATALKGIGPATASLVLSCADKNCIPFFSDELFRFVHWDGSGDGIKPAAKGNEWDRTIGYTMKEYKRLVERIGQLRAILAGNGADMAALDLEKAAWVMGKERMEIDGIASELTSSSSSVSTSTPKSSSKRARNAKDDGEDQLDTSKPKRGKANTAPKPATKPEAKSNIAKKAKSKTGTG